MITVYDYWLAEKLLRNRKDTKKIAEMFPEGFDAYSADLSDRHLFSDISESCMRDLEDKNLNTANKIMESCVKHGIIAVKLGSPGYPPLLADIECPPYMLFCKGNVSLLNTTFAVSMVGTRSMTTAGKYSAFKMAYEIAESGAVIVSGMALGIDSMCHAGAIAAGGKTIAVLGSGVDVVYPRAHATLYNHLVDRGGLVISEFLPGTRPYGHNFPVRNRVIAGISYATVIVEATRNSGALITASEAIKEGRTAFSVPGYVYSAASYGTNELIRSGVRTATKAITVINEYSGLGNARVNFKCRSAPSVSMCDRLVNELRIETKVYDPSANICKIDPDEIFKDTENAKVDFPFEVVQKSGKRRKKQSTKSEENSFEEAEQIFDEKASEENASKVRERFPTVDDLCEQCALFGVEPCEDIRKVCEEISGREETDVETLHREGCSTDTALQVLTLLSSAGMLTENAGGKFRLCKISDEKSV